MKTTGSGGTAAELEALTTRCSGTPARQYFEESAREEASTRIQARWRAIYQVRKMGSVAADLRVRYQSRRKLRKLTATAGHLYTLLVLASDTIARHGNGAPKNTYMAQTWTKLRAAASLVVKATLPVVQWCDKVSPVAEPVHFLVPEMAPRSLQGKAIDVSLFPASPACTCALCHCNRFFSLLGNRGNTCASASVRSVF